MSDKDAKPIKRRGKYVCSKCGKSAYYDGRCGDSAILICGCDEWKDDYNDGRD
jgi:hypothetical protein